MPPWDPSFLGAFFLSGALAVMSMEAIAADTPGTPRLTPPAQRKFAQQVLRTEAEALLAISTRLDASYCQATEALFACKGCVLVTGMGKAGLVGQKIAATLCSTGTRAHFVHPAEAIHGDLGRFGPDDVVLLLSQSGETEEIVQLLAALATRELPLIALTGRPDSALGRTARTTLDLGHLEEACPLGLAPSTSTTAMLALGDALALTVSRMKDFRAEDFAQLHPGGSLGRKLSRVENNMRPLARCRLAHDSSSLRDVLVRGSQPGRRTGAIMLTDEQGRLSGVFTDSDLARLFEQRAEHILEQPIRQAMTTAPITVTQGTMLTDAIQTMAQRKISELPVVDADLRPVGLLDITDLLPATEEFAQPARSPESPADSDHGLRVFSNRDSRCA